MNLYRGQTETKRGKGRHTQRQTYRGRETSGKEEGKKSESEEGTE